MKKILKNKLYKDENIFNYFEQYEDHSKLTIKDKNNDYKTIKFDNESFDEMIKFVWRITSYEKILNQYNNDLGYVLFGTNNLIFGFKNKDVYDFRRDNITMRLEKRPKSDLPKYIYEEIDYGKDCYRKIVVRIRKGKNREHVFCKSFSVNRYGYNGAMLKAIIARNKFLKTIK